MIKIQKINDDSDEVVTKGWFRTAFREGIDELAMLINKSFVGVESRMAKQEDLLALTERVVGLEKEMKGSMVILIPFSWSSKPSENASTG
jgi:hypothetical protein